MIYSIIGIQTSTGAKPDGKNEHVLWMSTRNAAPDKEAKTYVSHAHQTRSYTASERLMYEHLATHGKQKLDTWQGIIWHWNMMDAGHSRTVRSTKRVNAAT
jgi:hypothetical protein